jgi:hypothetical protein
MGTKGDTRLGASWPAFTSQSVSPTWWGRGPHDTLTTLRLLVACLSIFWQETKKSKRRTNVHLATKMTTLHLIRLQKSRPDSKGQIVTRTTKKNYAARVHSPRADTKRRKCDKSPRKMQIDEHAYKRSRTHGPRRYACAHGVRDTKVITRVRSATKQFHAQTRARF